MWRKGKDGNKGEPVSLPWPSAGYLPASSQSVVSKKLHGLFLFRGKGKRLCKTQLYLHFSQKNLESRESGIREKYIYPKPWP